MRLRRPPPSTLLPAAFVALLAGGCGGDGSDIPIGDGDNATGTLSIAITDAPVDEVTEVWVQFTGLAVKPADDDPIEFTFDAPVNVDLLTLTGATSATLLNGETVPAGNYEWVRLDVNASFDGTLDSYVVEQAGGSVELQVPSQQGLRLVSGFTVLADATSRFVIEWDLRRALTDPLGQPGYFLRPALRITNLAEYGTITGTVADALVMDTGCDNDLAMDRGNLVYVYGGAEATPVDIDGTGDEPLTVARVTQNDQAAGAYTYSATFLPPDDYTVAFTCQGLADDPEVIDNLVFTGTRTVTVAAGEEVTADFP